MEAESVFGVTSTRSTPVRSGSLERTMTKTISLCRDFKEQFTGPMIREAHSILTEELVNTGFTKFKDSVLLAQPPDFVTAECAKFVQSCATLELGTLNVLFSEEIEDNGNRSLGDPGA